MNISQLEYLKELHSCGSFSIAAERLGITQPALSLQIQKLEEELEFKLLDRSKRPFRFGQRRLFQPHSRVRIIGSPCNKSQAQILYPEAV